MNELIHLDKAKAQIAKIQTIKEAKEHMSKAEALRIYAKKAGLGLVAQNRCAEYKMRIERRAGEILGNTVRPGNPQLLHDATIGKLPREINRTQSSRWQWEAKVPETKFEEFVASFTESGKELTTSELLRLAKFLERGIHRSEIPILPEGKYNVIYADPPWQYWEGGEKNQSQHYNTMTIEEIKDLSIQELADENCILFLWATSPILKDVFGIIENWGFEYSTIGFIWIKSKKDKTGFAFGCGNWTRANAEYCLIATKGSIERQDATISQVIYEPKEKHSKKPDIVRDKIVQLVGDLPRVELFARGKLPEGWKGWGDEADRI